MLSDLAFHLAAAGREVEVVTSRQRYDDPRAQLPAREIVRGVRVTRVRTSRFGRSFLPGRAIDYATFYVSAFFALLARRDATVVAMTDPPLISVIAALASKRLINWTQDLFPEVAQGLGVRAPRLLQRVRDWSLRRARVNVALSDAMAARIGGKAVVQHNWADEALTPIAPEANPLRAEWQLGDRFVVGYSGNLGRAHEFGTLLEAMRAVPEAQFLIIGGGAQLEAVRRETRDLGNVQFRPYQPRELLSQSLSAADAHVMSLQPQLEGLIVPSKFYGILAVARPVVFIGAADSDLAKLIVAHDCGIVVAQGDAQALAAGLRALARDPARAKAMGERGRALYVARFAPQVAFAHWEALLDA